jgi:hypothetical protein
MLTVLTHTRWILLYAIRLLLSAGEKWRKLILQEVYLDIHARFYEGYVIHRVVYKGPVDLCPARTGVATETSKQPGISDMKIKAIEEAMRHFQMI